MDPIFNAVVGLTPFVLYGIISVIIRHLGSKEDNPQ